MIKILCLVYFLFVSNTVSPNPLSQLVQSCNAGPSYSNPTSIPVVIQQPSNNNPYTQGATVQIPTGYSGPLGDTLNQILFNRILSNPSLQKIIDPNTKLYNQNGEEIRQVPKASAPNVINNYFIVPPEFFNLNDTAVKNGEDKVTVDERDRRPNRSKRRKRPKIVELSSAEEDDEVVTIKKSPVKRRLYREPENVKRNRKRTKDVNQSLEDIDKFDEFHEPSTRRERENTRNDRRFRVRKRNKEETITPASIEEYDYDLRDLEAERGFLKDKREKEIRRTTKPKPKVKVIYEDSQEVPEKPKPKQVKLSTISKGKEKELEAAVEVKKPKKQQRQDSADKRYEDKILKNIEIPTDIPNRETSESRKTRGSKRNASKKVPEPKNTEEPNTKQNITPFPDEVMNNFFPYMQMGNYYNPNSNYPYNFDQYYQYINPVGNSNGNRNQKKRKHQNKKSGNATSNTHTIEIKLKPRMKANTTVVSTTEKPNVTEVMVSIEVDDDTESHEQVTEIPMQMPHKVSPVINEAECSRECYESFSKLDDLHNFFTPELGTEDGVRSISNNGIINDYYPVFDDDVYYNPYVENMEDIEDDRYFYETGNEGNTKRERKKLDRYEDLKSAKRETNGRELKNPDFKTTKVTDINKFDHNEYLAHIASFSEAPEHKVKPSTEIKRVKVPPKNTRVKTDNVETVYAGSKVAKYGVPLDESVEDSSADVPSSDEYSDGHATYVIAKSLGRPEDYW